MADIKWSLLEKENMNAYRKALATLLCVVRKKRNKRMNRIVSSAIPPLLFPFRRHGKANNKWPPNNSIIWSIFARHQFTHQWPNQMRLVVLFFNFSIFLIGGTASSAYSVLLLCMATLLPSAAPRGTHKFIRFNRMPFLFALPSRVKTLQRIGTRTAWTRPSERQSDSVWRKHWTTTNMLSIDIDTAFEHFQILSRVGSRMKMKMNPNK